MQEINKHGGSRPNSGRKPGNYVSMEVLLPPEDKAAIKAKFGHTFNSKFREWVKTLIG